MLAHVLNRGVDKRKIFLNDRDYLRFIHDLFVFNDEKNIKNNFLLLEESEEEQKARAAKNTLVNVHAFCLMPNHYHLLLSPNVENGLPLFMKKLNGGYAKYFNTKYERKGTLFERRYKSVPITTEAHHLHLPYYIHLNPLDLTQPEWRMHQFNDKKAAMRSLKTYRWSSHLDYLGVKNFPLVTQRKYLLELFGGNNGYRKSIERYLGEPCAMSDVAQE